MIDKEKLIPKLDKWREARIEMEEFGVWQYELVEFQMGNEKFFSLKGLDKSELTINIRRLDDDYPWKANLKIGKYTLYTILNRKGYAEYFPEKVKKQDDFIVLEGVKYRRGV